MPTGSFRFRQNKRFVNSTFRGARRDTFPYIPYPTEGRVLDLSSFTFESVEVADISGENNNAALYSGRGVNLAGSDYVELPDVGTTKSITVLARSSTDTTLYATDDATQTEDATAALVADGTWQEVTLTFASAITGEIRLGSDGASFFAGDLANARCRDASDDLLDQFYLNEHTDTAASGLDGLPCIGLEGNIGQYVGCAAVIQVTGDVGGLTPPQVLGMDFNQYRWFNGVDTSLDYGSPLLPATADFDETFYWYIGETSTPTSNVYALEQATSGTSFFGISLTSTGLIALVGGSGSATNLVSTSASPYYSSLVKVRLTRSSGVFELFLNDVSIGTESNGYALQQVNTVWGASSFLSGGRNVIGLIYGDNVTGTESGTFENVLAPKALTGSNDALGNAIENLRTNKTFNADSSGRWEVADAASLAVCKSWSCRYYHTTGTADIILDLGGPTIEATAGNALTSTGITSPTYYVNNAAGTALSAGWNSICVTTATATDCGPISGGDPTALESDVKVYNLELTAEQVETLP